MIPPVGLGIFEGAKSTGKLASCREEFIKGTTLDLPLIARNPEVNPQWKGASDGGTAAAAGIELLPVLTRTFLHLVLSLDCTIHR